MAVPLVLLFAEGDGGFILHGHEDSLCVPEY
jgi:hypothetical protein